MKTVLWSCLNIDCVDQLLSAKTNYLRAAFQFDVDHATVIDFTLGLNSNILICLKNIFCRKIRDMKRHSVNCLMALRVSFFVCVFCLIFNGYILQWQKVCKRLKQLFSLFHFLCVVFVSFQWVLNDKRCERDEKKIFDIIDQLLRPTLCQSWCL